MPSKSQALLFFALVTSLFALGKDMDQKSPISYPYIASPERTKRILTHWKTIKLKMSSHEVTQLMGTPDEDLPLYSPHSKQSKIIGKTYWYIIQRLQKSGSQMDKKEKLVRISFDLKDTVTAIDHWGLDL